MVGMGQKSSYIPFLYNAAPIHCRPRKMGGGRHPGIYADWHPELHESCEAYDTSVLVAGREDAAGREQAI